MCKTPKFFLQEFEFFVSGFLKPLQLQGFFVVDLHNIYVETRIKHTISCGFFVDREKFL